MAHKLLRNAPHPFVLGKRVYTFETDSPKTKLSFRAIEVHRIDHDTAAELAEAERLMAEWEANG